MTPDILGSQEQSEIIEMYRRDRELIFYSGGSKNFLKKIKREVISQSDKVTELWISGESGGTNKTGSCGQIAAELTFNPMFRRKLEEATGKTPLVHWLPLGLGTRDLSERGEITSPHPDYTKEDFGKVRPYLDMIRSKGHELLPTLYPDCANVLLVECPISIIERPFIPGADSFVLLRLSNPIAQEDAAAIREHTHDFNDTIVEQYLGRNVVLDADIQVADIAWLQGNGKSAEVGRNIMNNRMIEAKGDMPGCPDFSLEDLQNNPDLRNKIVLRRYYNFLRKKWGIGKERFRIEDMPYIAQEKHFFIGLLLDHMLDPRLFPC